MSGATLYAAEAEVAEAMARACPGQRFIYATGPVLDPAHPTVALVRGLVDRGQARSHAAGRDGNGQLRHVVVKCEVRGPAKADHAGKPLLIDRLNVGPEFMETLTGRVLRRLVAAAEAGLPCPSNAELGRALGLSRDQAQYQIALLVGQQLIEVINPTPRSRVVLIKATGQRTAEAGAHERTAG